METKEKLAALREHLGLTRAQTAHQAGIHPSQWTRYEKGRQEPSRATLRKISKAFNISVGHFDEEPEGAASPPAALSQRPLAAPDVRALVQRFHRLLQGLPPPGEARRRAVLRHLRLQLDLLGDLLQDATPALRDEDYGDPRLLRVVRQFLRTYESGRPEQQDQILQIFLAAEAKARKIVGG